MTVKELTTLLLAHDPDMEMAIYDKDWGPCLAEKLEVQDYDYGKYGKKVLVLD